MHDGLRVAELDAERATALQHLADHTLVLTGALSAGIAVLEDGEFVFGGNAGDPALAPRPRYVAGEGTLGAEALLAGEMLRLQPDVDPPLPEPWTGRASLVCPLLFHGSTLGILGITGARGVPFSTDAERRLEGCAALAAIVVASQDSQRDGSLRRSITAGDRDRARWALELQAGPLQLLAAIRMALKRLLRDPEIGTHQATLSEIEILLADAVRDVRELITDLHPAALDDLGLVPAVEAIVQRVRDRVGLRIVVDTRPPARRLTPEIEAAACSVVNTALRNVEMHAHADRVEVHLRDDGEYLRVEVCDDGTGFAADALGVGESLLALRERVGLVGGTVHVGDQPAGGVVVRAEIPLAWREDGGTPLLS